ncbi:DUF2970 domain-containing protein [Variovorax sp. JS1663]|uniref:DUF2970 domain-containing protein n=1 Tax=Variovorax sp. JS1663 TaxID=1851577 RepID=UPI001EDDCFCA|nr:DUF2970 domain-containing protein [Variovorax sp. JS1663]
MDARSMDMSNFLGSLRAVLWAAIGLGGRRADADKRVNHQSLPLLLAIAFVLVVGLIAGLVGVAHLAAGA